MTTGIPKDAREVYMNEEGEPVAFCPKESRGVTDATVNTMNFPIHPRLARLISVLISAKGRPVVVGGSVRDWLLGIEPKDFDVEVFGLDIEALAAALHDFHVDAVGRSFGVFKVTIDGETFDVSLPRRESKEGRGHKGFMVSADPDMSLVEAASRRDFTINSVGWDCISSQLLDPFGGVADIAAKVLRHTSPAFAEDPLRVLRGCQFAARFGFTMLPETVALCRSLAGELGSLPVERLWTEWVKLLTRSPKPSVGLDALVETGAIDLFPEVKAMLNVPQEPEWHPENGPHGSLWAHNGMVTDMAVRVLDDDGVTDSVERLIVILGAFCHDLGKPATTVFERGRWRSLAHEEAGEAPTKSFLTRIGCPPAIIEAVVPLVMNHLKPFHYARDKASNSAVRRLAMKAPLLRLSRVARADWLGRTTPEALACTDSRTIEEIVWLLAKADELSVKDGAPKPYLMGRHLLDLGFKPGKAMGLALAQAFEAQLDGSFGNTDEAIEWARNTLRIDA